MESPTPYCFLKMKTSRAFALDFSKAIVHEDTDFFIVNKPPGIATLHDHASPINVLELARAYHSSSQVCHRLDKETSGLLVVAKHAEAYRHFANLLTNREVHKLYHALVSGRVELDEEINAPLYTSSSRSRVDFQQGKPSATLIQTLYIYKAHTLLACMPITGRMHQIRVHLAHIGLPICGDTEYGGKHIYLSSVKKSYKIGKFETEKPLINRLTLHAAGLTFIGLDNKELKLQAPHPRDFEVVLKQLKKNE